MTTKCRIFLSFLVLPIAVTSSAMADSYRPLKDNPNALRLSYGEFTPGGDSIYWQQRESDFFGSSDDFENDRYGVEYSRMLTERWGYTISTGIWEGEQTTSFLDFVDNDGLDIFHTTTLEQIDLGAGFVFYPFRRDSPVAPYLGGGFQVALYDLTEAGDFIDFDSRTLDIFSGSFHDSGSTVGGYLDIGLEIPIGRTFAIFGEYTWAWSETDLGQDFEDFGAIDLGGEEFKVGASFRF